MPILRIDKECRLYCFVSFLLSPNIWISSFIFPYNLFSVKEFTLKFSLFILFITRKESSAGNIHHPSPKTFRCLLICWCSSSYLSEHVPLPHTERRPKSGRYSEEQVFQLKLYFTHMQNTSPFCPPTETPARCWSNLPILSSSQYALSPSFGSSFYLLLQDTGIHSIPLPELQLCPWPGQLALCRAGGRRRSEHNPI